MAKDLTYIAKTNFRNSEQKFGIKRNDRRQHMYVIGKTGTGKTQFLKNMAMQDINNGQGLAVIDPHGEFVEEILDSVPVSRINDVVYFNPSDMDHPVSFNIMDVPDPKYKHLIASGLIGIFTKIWANVWSARMEYILANCILALLDTPGTTLLGIPRMLVDRDYRQKIINNLKDPVVKSFWVNEYEEWESRYRNEAIAPVQNKVGQFLNVSFVRNIVGQAKNTIDIDEIMNTGKILLVNVSKGRIGEDNSAILGAMLITKIQLVAMERVRIPEEERKDFYMYVDEFQNFATDSFVNILSEARKYRLDLIIAHQYIGQLVTDTSTAVRDAVFGNVGTMVSFRVGAGDAEFLEQEFTPEFEQNDLIRLDNRNVYLKLMIDGITSRPFSATTITLAPIPRDEKKREKMIKTSRAKYALPVKDVEDEINRWASSQDVPTRQGSSDFSNPQNSSRAQYKPNGSKLSSDSRNSTGEAKLYDAVCSNCGKPTKVIFPPEPGRAVYCKSCLKKLKAGEIQSAPSTPARAMPGVSEQKSWQSENKQSGSKQERDAALADLGIEFAPSSGRTQSRPAIRQDSTASRTQSSPVQKPRTPSLSLNEIMQKGENVPFNKSKKEKKPVDLADLRKALEESLEKKDKPFDTVQGEATASEELEERVDEEKYEDKTSFPNQDK
ncbi:MAG: type IV secretion system DNA-binding domain-containing protein [Candidatus Staskawiczbacteria bacterium]|nr:type IV secretion system DNA-binding domain-containing protein [Candidatus Staskawiczbacteria bacterium]